LKEKPPTPLVAERVEQSTGGVISQDVKSVGTRPSTGSARHGDHNEHGTAQGVLSGMERHTSDIAYPLRFPFWVVATPHFSGNRLCRSVRSCGTWVPAECH